MGRRRVARRRESIDITLALDAASDNGTRRADIAVDAAIGLREYIPAVETPGAPAGTPDPTAAADAGPSSLHSGIAEPGTGRTSDAVSGARGSGFALPVTGGAISVSALLVGAGAVIVGLGLWSLSRGRRRAG